VGFKQFETVSKWIVDVNVVIPRERFSLYHFVPCFLQARNDDVQAFDE
jgi:hypothetical protein